MKQISASLMCSKHLLNLSNEIKLLEDLKIDMLHLDAMDGHFVNNITFGPDILNAIHNSTKLPCDYHLMMDDPLQFIERLELSRNDIVTIHAEIDNDKFDKAIKYLNSLKKRGVKIGVAINPSTAIEALIDYFEYIDMILIMLINPGFAGQPIIPGILKKPKYVREYLNEIGYDNIVISVDGGISHERAKLLSKTGVDIFVGGTSGLFRQNTDMKECVEQFRKNIEITSDNLLKYM